MNLFDYESFSPPTTASKKSAKLAAEAAYVPLALVPEDDGFLTFVPRPLVPEMDGDNYGMAPFWAWYHSNLQSPTPLGV